MREQPWEKVSPALHSWAESLDPRDSLYEHHLLEALWLYQDFDQPQDKILDNLLIAKDFRARTAATRVLRYWYGRIPDALSLMRARVNDESARVRLEAVVALTDFRAEEALPAALDVFKHPTD